MNHCLTKVKAFYTFPQGKQIPLLEISRSIKEELS